MLASRIKHEDLGQILMLILVKVLFKGVSECDSLFRFNGIHQSRQTLHLYLFLCKLCFVLFWNNKQWKNSIAFWFCWAKVFLSSEKLEGFFSPLDSKTSAKLCSLHGSQPTAESLLFNVSELEPKGHLYIILGSPPLVIPKTSSSLFHTEEEQDCNGFLLWTFVLLELEDVTWVCLKSFESIDCSAAQNWVDYSVTVGFLNQLYNWMFLSKVRDISTLYKIYLYTDISVYQYIQIHISV